MECAGLKNCHFCWNGRNKFQGFVINGGYKDNRYLLCVRLLGQLLKKVKFILGSCQYSSP